MTLTNIQQKITNSKLIIFVASIPFFSELGRIDFVVGCKKWNDN